MDDTRHIQLCDFGLSDFSDTTNASVSSAIPGATRCMAPEIHEPKRFGFLHLRHTMASDVFSWGQACWQVSSFCFSRSSRVSDVNALGTQMWTGVLPFNDLNNAQALLAIVDGKHPERASSPRPIPDALWDAMTSCWQFQPASRPTTGMLHDRLRAALNPISRPITAFREPNPKRLALYIPTLATVDSESSSSNSSSSGSPTVVNHAPPHNQDPLPCCRPEVVAEAEKPYCEATSNPVSPVSPTRRAESVRSLASIYPNYDRLVPQRIYRPLITLAGEGTSNTALVMFYVKGPRGCGINCKDALEQRFGELLSPYDNVDCLQTMNLWILVSYSTSCRQNTLMNTVQWPDYEPWSCPMTPKGSSSSTVVTRWSLAAHVSRCVQWFIDVSVTPGSTRISYFISHG